MDSMASATWTKLLNRELFRLTLLVFASHIVAPFATVALKTD
jgi:hypothetical protein